MLMDQPCRVFIVDRDRRSTLKALIGVEQIETGVSAFIDPEALHFRALSSLPH
jgi:hypothetical protein